MSLVTSNAYGKITVTEDAIAQVAGMATLECYGIVDLTPTTFGDSFNELLRKNKLGRGIRVSTSGDRITIALNVVLKYGVSIDAVCESLKKTVKYTVEKFSGMRVVDVAVKVVGVRV